MSVNEYLTYAASLLDTLGLTPFLVAMLVIVLAASLIRALRN